MIKRRAIAILLITIAAGAAFALDPRTPISQYGHRAWHTEDGLPQSTVQAIAQTRDGYIWIGTQDGLTRFDGVTFTKFGEKSTPIRDAFVFAFAVDRHDTLWIGASDAHPLITYQHGSFTYIDLAAVHVHDVFSLAVANDGSIWMGTNNGVVQRSENGTLRQWTEKEGLPSPTVRRIFIDRSGSVWAGTEHGLTRIVDGRVIPAGRQIGLPAGAVRALYEDSRGRLWIGMSEGAYCVSDGVARARPELADIATAFVSSILEDGRHTLWFGTNIGLKRLAADGTSSPLESERLSGRFVLSLFEDREHALWTGTFSGVDQLRDTAFLPWSREQGLRDDGVFAIGKGRYGSVWFGTFGGLGELHPDGSLHWYSRKEGLSNETIIAIAPRREGGVWAGTYGGGVCRVGHGPTQCFGTANGLSHGVVTSIVEDDDGGVWLGTLGGGLDHMHDGIVETYGARNGLPSPRIVTLTRARHGGLWIGMIMGGVAHFRDGKVTRVLNLGAKGTNVRSIIEDEDGGLWLGSDDPGLMYVKNDRITTFPLARYLPDPSVNWIVDSKGFLWLLSRPEIARIDKAELLRFARGETRVLHPTRFSSADGVRCSDFPTGQPSAFEGDDGAMWFNGKTGAAMLPVGALEQRSVISPHVVLEQATADEMPLSGASPQIESSRARVTFRYTAIHFGSPDQLRFRYRLDGYDRGWIDAGKTRTAEYMNLPPGDYTFRVMAANADGQWNERRSAALHFTRKPAFHETWMFHLVCASLVALIAGLIYKARVRLLQAREANLLERIDQRTHQLRESMQIAELLSLEQRTILDAAGEGIFGLDANGNATFVNLRAALMLGAPVNELLGSTLHDVIHVANSDCAVPPLDGCLVCSTVVDPPMRVAQTATFAHRNGNMLPVEYTSNVVTNDAGARTGVVVTFRDITERQSIERMKSEFVSTVSHELRTPLTSIRGALGLLAGGMVGEIAPRGQRMLDIAVNNTDRLVRLINDILDVERINSGNVELNRRLVDAHDVMLQSAEVMTAITERAGIALVIEPIHLTLWIDCDRVVQTLTNLLGNAIKFSVRGSMVTLSAAVKGREFIFRVADRGRGIPADKLEMIFERFKQVDASDSRDKGGTGLGLAICRSIAAAHGGRIWAESSVGAGSVFHFAVPLDVLCTPEATEEEEVSGAA